MLNIKYRQTDNNHYIMRLPKYPKGLKARVRKLEAKKAQADKVAARKKEIAALKKRENDLRNKLS